MKSKYRSDNIILTALTICCAAVWSFPLYWAIATSLKPEAKVVSDKGLFPETLDFTSYTDALFDSNLMIWFLNSVVTASIITLVVIVTSMMCGYAISQLRFKGRMTLYMVILASFMIPAQALIVSQFVLMSDFNLVNTWGGIILPQLIAPIAVIVYKQFFDAVPKEMREAVVLDGGNEFQILTRVYIPLNRGITVALAIVTFIAAWNAFLWPLLVVTSQDMMTIPVGITQVEDNFGIQYAHEMAIAVLAALPVAMLYLFFQRRVTQAIMITSGIKG